MRGGMQNAPARRCRYNGSSMPFQELVEAEGHLIDSHIMENIFDKVVEYHGRCEGRSEEHTSELQSPCNGGCRLTVEKENRARACTAARAPAPRVGRTQTRTTSP